MTLFKYSCWLDCSQAFKGVNEKPQGNMPHCNALQYSHLLRSFASHFKYGKNGLDK